MFEAGSRHRHVRIFHRDPLGENAAALLDAATPVEGYQWAPEELEGPSRTGRVTCGATAGAKCET
jgi:hypothetical protein